jgi:hypothetical protein
VFLTQQIEHKEPQTKGKMEEGKYCKEEKEELTKRREEKGEW